VAVILRRNEVQLDEAAIFEVLNSIDGPVGKLLIELSDRVVIVATGVVHVFPGTPRSTIWAWGSTAVLPPGTTKASIRPHVAHGSRTGHIYGGADALAVPGIFLEHPAEQMYDQYGFLSTGLEALVI